MGPTPSDSSHSDVIWVASRNRAAALDESRANPTQEVRLASFRGFADRDLEFLREWGHLQRLTLMLLEGVDLSGLRHVPHLSVLSVDSCDGAIDFEWTPELKELHLFWTRAVNLRSLPVSLERLDLHKFGAGGLTLEALPTLPKLTLLSLVNSSLRTLAGVGRFPNLVELRLWRVTRLESVRAIVDEGLARLEVLCCASGKRVRDFDTLGAQRTLRTLRLNSCGELASLAFTLGLERLEELRFMETTIRDGDMSPCLRLKRVAFTSRRGLSHSLREVLAQIERRS